MMINEFEQAVKSAAGESPKYLFPEMGKKTHASQLQIHFRVKQLKKKIGPNCAECLSQILENVNTGS